MTTTIPATGIGIVPLPALEQAIDERYLSIKERETIRDLLTAGKSQRKIAEALGRSVSTVSREIARNSTPEGRYHPYAAHLNSCRILPVPRSPTDFDVVLFQSETLVCFPAINITETSCNFIKLLVYNFMNERRYDVFLYGEPVSATSNSASRADDACGHEWNVGPSRRYSPDNYLQLDADSARKLKRNPACRP
ncbi:helix-turn-helix domain-containing protein [Arthrobacter sp. ISL-65]|uniref:helix-turn-helix domain-containing protein n=1 Tax=Arthrobacter sp. ISL-65 TaxID=2819112 RepID=UPI001BE6102E|nr:helix-turn-helix domain-containing protein [Arthrobacter sp. ISL-65]